MTVNKKTRAFAACLLVAIFVFCGCSLDGINDLMSPLTDLDSGVYILGSKVEVDTSKNDGYYYSRLSEDQQLIYSAAKLALDLGADSYVCKGVDYKEYLDIYGEALSALIYDCPEYFWLNGEVSANASYVEGSDKGNVTVNIGVYEYWRGAGIDSDGFNNRVNEILTEVSDLDNDYEKAKAVHDILIENTEYDITAYEAGSDIDSQTDAFVNTAYGAVVEGRAMCGGYARAFGLLMKKLGIESVYVTGTADGEPHAWNIIKLDGEYYHVDLTWDDADGDPCEILYGYFCVTDADIFKTHTPDPEYVYMSASATDCNYYVREGLYLEKYTFNAVNEMLANREVKDSVSFRCASSVVLEFAVENLIENSKVYDLEFMKDNSSYQYIVDENQYIITFIVG